MSGSMVHDPGPPPDYKQTPGGIIVPTAAELAQHAPTPAFDESRTVFLSEKDCNEHIAECDRRGLDRPRRVTINGLPFKVKRRAAPPRKPESAADSDAL